MAEFGKVISRLCPACATSYFQKIELKNGDILYAHRIQARDSSAFIAIGCKMVQHTTEIVSYEEDLTASECRDKFLERARASVRGVTTN